MHHKRQYKDTKNLVSGGPRPRRLAVTRAAELKGWPAVADLVSADLV
ncbi:hypothetical protein [Desulforamulus aquiferis]|uniref:Uncharacterized protein n=1 Tax=Desulforamulus aquiferis TaxID=1397668 RepID=A0AAW7ZEU0_9FIRM|nr:hypothetical protein [Desulforamulus aquiferis]MDO7787887.1 hypothetical protein [Desulforamulus aquiferis]